MTIQILMKIVKELYLKWNLKLKKINTSQPDESVKDHKIDKLYKKNSTNKIIRRDCI